MEKAYFASKLQNSRKNILSLTRPLAPYISGAPTAPLWHRTFKTRMCAPAQCVWPCDSMFQYADQQSLMTVVLVDLVTDSHQGIGGSVRNGN
jgi:hypothetical protein